MSARHGQAILHRSLLFGVCALTMTGSALAQSLNGSDEAAARFQREEGVNTARGGPIGEPERLTGTGFKKLESDAQIETIDGVVTANFALSWRMASSPVTTEDDAKHAVITAGFTSATLKASVPLSQGDDLQPISFKNVGNKGKLTLGFNHFRPRVVSAVGTSDLYFSYAQACIREAGAEWLEGLSAPNTEQIGQVDRLVAGMEEMRRTSESWDDALRSLTAEQAASQRAIKDIAPLAAAHCLPGGGGAVTDDLSLARLYARKAGLPLPGALSGLNRTLFVGGEASLGYNKFSVLDRTAFRTVTRDRVGIDVNAHVGMLFPSSGLMLSAGGGYTRAYEAKDEAEVCSAPNAMGQTTCIKGQDGKPKRSETGYADTTLRVVLLRGEDGLGKVAMAPRVTYLFEDDAFEFKLPIYLQRGKDGGLDGGIQGIYNTDEKKVFVGAFIGVPFYGL